MGATWSETNGQQVNITPDPTAKKDSNENNNIIPATSSGYNGRSDSKDAIQLKLTVESKPTEHTTTRPTPTIAPILPQEILEETHQRLLTTYKESTTANLEKWRQNKRAQLPQADIIVDTKSIYFAMSCFSPDWIRKHQTTLCNYIEKEKDIITVLCESTMNAGIHKASDQFSQAGLQVVVNLSNHSRELSKIICAVPGYLQFLYDILKKHKDSAETMISSVEKLIIRVLSIIYNVAMIDSNIPALQEMAFTEVVTIYLAFPNDTIRLTAVLGMAYIMKEEESHYVEANTSVITFLLNIFKTSLTSSDRTAMDGHGMIWGVLELAKGIGRLARNDGNKKLLVDEGCLPLLLRLAKSSDMEEQKEALKSIWALAFDEGNQDKILDEPGLIEFLDEQRKTGPADSKATCYDILWTMRHKLSQSDQHSAIGMGATWQETNVQQVNITPDPTAKKDSNENNSIIPATSSGYNGRSDSKDVTQPKLTVESKPTEHTTTRPTPIIAPILPQETLEETHQRLLKKYKESTTANLEKWRENKQALLPQVDIIVDTYNIFFAMRLFSPDWIRKYRTSLCNYIEKEKDIITVLCESTMNAGIDKASDEFSQAGLLVVVNLSNHSRELSKIICAFPGYLQFLYDILKKHKDSAETVISSVEQLIVRVLLIIHNVAMTDSNIPALQEMAFTEVLRIYLAFPNEKIRLSAVLGMAYIMKEEESHYVEANTSVITLLLNMFKTSLTSSDRTAMDCRRMIWGVLGLAKGIGRLARNDGNKKLLVDEGCLPLLLRLAKSSDMEEQKEALKSIWALAFDEGNQDKILDEPGLIEFLDEQHKTGPADSKATCYGILWTMRYKLSQSDQHSAIGKRLTKKADSSKHTALEKADREKSEKEEKSTVGTKGHVMISYQWTNQEILMKVRDRIRALDEKVWMDIDDMQGSTLQAAADAIENADVVLICMSRNYKDSPNCRAEAEYAHQLRKKIIPLIMERGYTPDGWLGIILGAKLYYDFSGTYTFESRIDGLLKEVYQTMNGVAKPLPSTSGAAVDYDVVDGPNDVIVPERSQPLYAPSRVPYYMPYYMHPVRRLGPVKNWNQQQVKDWLKKHELSGSRIKKLNCKEIAFLQKVQETDPECYHQMLKTDLGLKTLSELANFESAMDDLP